MSTIAAFKNAGFGIKALKSWNARDGVGTQCSVTLNGKVVGEYTNNGDGGEGYIRWAKFNEEAEDAFNAMLASLPEVKWADVGLPNTSVADGYRPDADHVMAEVCDDVDTQKKMAAAVKRATKAGKTLFKSVGQAEGVYSIINAPVGSELANKVLAKYPGAVVLNP